jgi:hypothetical protein
MKEEATLNSEGTYIQFVEAQCPKGYKTRAWNIAPKDEGPNYHWIGGVRWYAPWRKYCFFPQPNTVYEQLCLREIADFCERETAAHKERKAA